MDKGYDYSLAKLAPLLEAVDYRILNLETPLTFRLDTSLRGKEYIHYSDPVKTRAALGRFGPIAYSLANNHTLDQGPPGLVDTMKSLDQAGARHFGAGTNITEAVRPLLQTFQIGTTSFTLAVFGGLEYNKIYADQYHFYADASNPGVVPIDVHAVEEAIRDLRGRNQNLFVIYFMHVLQNYFWKTPSQVATAGALRKAGVDLVIGSGAHMLQEVEFDGTQWTFYGLGDFIFNSGGRYASLHAPPYSGPLVVDFSMDNDRLETTFRMYPIVSANTIINYQPRFVTEEELTTINSLLLARGRWPTTILAAVTRGQDQIGWYLEFSSQNGTNPLH